MNELERAAEGYLKAGLPVIALTDKMPNWHVFKHGLDDAMVPEYLDDERWLDARKLAFTHPKTTGIAIVIPYPYVVVDIDGEIGAQAYKDLLGGDGDLGSPSWSMQTKHGLHLWYSCVTPTGSMKLGPQLDLKGQNSYVAVAPSAFAPCSEDPCPRDHQPVLRYEWLIAPSKYDPVMEVPDALGARIRDHKFDVERAIIAKAAKRRIRHEVLEGGRLWASFGFEHLIERMGSEPKGNRNNFLHWAAATMAEEGATDEEFEALIAQAPDLGHAARRTVASARRGRG